MYFLEEGGGGPPPPRTARQFDDVPTKRSLRGAGVAKQGSQARFPLPALCWFGFLPPFAENLEKLCVFERPNCENAGKPVFFCWKYWGAEGKCKEAQVK